MLWYIYKKKCYAAVWKYIQFYHLKKWYHYHFCFCKNVYLQISFIIIFTYNTHKIMRSIHIKLKICFLQGWVWNKHRVGQKRHVYLCCIIYFILYWDYVLFVKLNIYLFKKKRRFYIASNIWRKKGIETSLSSNAWMSRSRSWCKRFEITQKRHNACALNYTSCPDPNPMLSVPLRCTASVL